MARATIPVPPAPDVVPPMPIQPGRPGGPGKQPADVVSPTSYFRTMFRKNPEMLRIKSNDVALERYMQDYKVKEVPKNVRQILSNVKSVTRRELAINQRAARANSLHASLQADQSGPTVMPEQRKRHRRLTKRNPLERIEDMIDDCQVACLQLDDDDLTRVILHLRQARRELILRMPRTKNS